MGTHFISEKAFLRETQTMSAAFEISSLSDVSPQKQHGGRNQMMTQVSGNGVRTQVKLRQSNFLFPKTWEQYRYTGSGALGDVEYPFIAITPRSTLTRSGSTC